MPWVDVVNAKHMAYVDANVRRDMLGSNRELPDLDSERLFSEVNFC